jgi:serine/threonine protein phosphatase PrpC
MQELYTEIFREVDREIGNHPLCRPFHSGSTACVVLLSPSKLYVANVGDSRAVLGSRSTKYNKQITSSDPVKDDDLPGDTGTIQAIELTIDQNANDPVERQRILDAGGHVTLPRKGFENEIPARVWLDDRCTQIGLGMSRSFGDFVLKDVGVIVDPVVTELDLDPGHQVLYRDYDAFLFVHYVSNSFYCNVF